MSDYRNKTVRGYRLDVEIGAGGFGTVWHAYQEVLNREVAVKVIKEKYVNNPQFVRQFEAEARIIGRLEHFNIVTLYDYWRDPSGAYLIMRWLRGGSLRGFLKTSKLDVPQTVRVINQTAAALSFAHQHNVIHRDIKPENILLDTEGNAFLTDFGIAVDLRSQDNVSMENISFGSPDYVAPEQLKDKVITPRSDIYSLGIMLYELLAGERPFVSKDPKEIMKMQLFNPVPSLRLKRPDLPPEIDTVIWQSTAKNPSHRYDNILELAVAFQNIARKMENVPANYIISTQRHKPIQIQQAPPSQAGGNLTTGNFNDDSGTTNFEELSGRSDTNQIPEFASDVPQPGKNIETIQDALDTNELEDYDDTYERQRQLDTFIFDGDGEDQGKDALNTAVLPDDEGDVEAGTGEAFGTAVFDDLAGEQPAFSGNYAGSDDDPLHTAQLPDSGDDPLHTAQLPDSDDDPLHTAQLPDDMHTPVQPVAGIEDSGDVVNTPVPEPDPSYVDDYYPEETNRFGDYRNLVTLTIEGEGPPNPYKGLRAFEEADAGSFFGREEIVSDLVNDFGQNEDRFLAIIGPSGSGKSSVVRAGMIPAFRRGAVEGSADWFYSKMVPSDDPFRELREAILRVAIIAPENWGDALGDDPRGLHKLLDQILPDDGSDLLLFIDQFEEVFTLGDDEEQRELFLNSLWFATQQQNSRLRLIVTLRADFYDRPLYYPQFGKLLQQNTEVMLPLSLQELESTIIGPAARVGLLIEPALKNAILNDVFNQPGALPLLQYALTELYDRKKPHQQALTIEQYQDIGGIEGALAKRAEEIYASLSSEEQAFTRQLFLRIIAIDDNGTVTRRRVAWEEMKQGVSDPNILQDVIEAFSKHRLLTRDLDQVSRAPTVEVAHEALIKGWSQLSQWIEQNRAALQKRQELRVEVDRWLATERDKSYIASGSRLAEFEGLVNNSVLSLRDEERDYIQISVKAREAAIERTRRINIALSVFSVVTLILFIAALISFGFANIARADAVEQAQVAQSRELAASSQTALQQDDLALLLAVEALAIDDTYEARHSMMLALQDNGLVQQYFHDYTGGVRALDYDTTGTIAVTGGLSEDGNTILRWDMTTNTIVGDPLTGHGSWINDIKISPDNTLIASASSDGTVRLWDMDSGAELAVFEGHSDPVWAIDFSLDSGTLASAGEDGQIIFWDVNNRVRQSTIELPLSDEDTIQTFDIDFNSSASLLASSGNDSLIRVWDVATGEQVLELAQHNNWVRSVQFDPADSAIISGDNDGVINFWNAEDGSLLVNPVRTIHSGGILSIVISTDGRFMATSGADANIIIWDLASQLQPVAVIDAHNDSVWDVEFNPVNRQLLSASSDGNMILSQLTSITHPGQLEFDTNQTIAEFEYDEVNDRVVLAGIPFGATNGTIQVLERETIELLYEFNIGTISEDSNQEAFVVTDLAVSNDGTTGAISLATGEVGAWEIATGDLLWIDNQHAAIPKELEFTPDSSRIISADETGQVVIWDVATGDTITTDIAGSGSGVTSMSISPDSQYLAIGGRGGIVLWNLQDETLISDSMTTHSDAVIALLFDHSSQSLFSSSRDRTIIQWDSATGNLMQEFEGHTDWVLSLALSPDGQTLVSGERTGSIRLWETATGRSVGNGLSAPAGWLTGLHFIDDSVVLGSNRDGGVVLSWTVDPNDWIDIACTISNRDLNRNEQLQYIRVEDYEPRCSQPSSE